MKRISTLVILGMTTAMLAACGDAENASTEAMPDTVEVPAEEALAPIDADPVEDEEAAGPPPAPVDPADNAPDQATTQEAAEAAEQVAADAEAAANAAAAAEDIDVETEEN